MNYMEWEDASDPKSLGPVLQYGRPQLAGGAQGGSFMLSIAVGARAQSTVEKERRDPFPTETVLQHPPSCSTALGLWVTTGTTW